jgi:uncharacterized membrane protein
MRKYFLLVLSIAVLASCSAPKYAYHFDHYDYNSGKKQADATTGKVTETPVDAETSPLTLPAETMVASADEKAVVLAEPTADMKAQAEAAKEKFAAMSKEERKAFKKEAKAQIRQYIKAAKSGDKAQMELAAKGMDKDLKMAAIFGAVGIVALLIGGDVFWVIGGIALLIGVVFFVMWLARQ